MAMQMLRTYKSERRMRRAGLLLVALALALGCDSAVDKQRYDFMLVQVQNIADQAARGEPVLPGFVFLAENDCMQAQRDKATIRAARALAAECDRSLQNIRAHVAK